MDPFRDPVEHPAYHERPLLHEPDTPRSTPAWYDRLDYGRWGFLAGLSGGVLILVAAFVVALFLSALAAFGASPAWAFDPGDEGPRDDGFPEVPLAIGAWGLVTGAVVLLAALRVKERPDDSAIAGVVMVSAGLLSFLATGGFLLGGVLAILGGVLAVAGARSIGLMRGPRLARAE